mmetsp:Transcript_110405/g.216479  ORF Transcript_110405/g.216479 Transcript_110405/m.216479 type:complete len:390 (+) Transcript_110405:57-1226(+)
MSSPSAPYQNMDPETCCQKTNRLCRKCVLGTCCFAIVAICLVQALLYCWATMKCSAGHLRDYEYPGGGPVNLVPRNSLLIEQDPRWWGESFINSPADDAGLPIGASSGVFYKTWGPIFNTYVYQDITGRETFLIRDRPIALGGSHKIMRCDGTGPVYVFSEGTHWLANNIRELFGMYTTRNFNIWEGSQKVAVSQKVGGGGQSHKQIIFRAPDEDVPFASCFLKERQVHGKFDEWFVQEYKNRSSTLPAYVPHSCCVLMAFRTSAQKAAAAKVHDAKDDKKPESFLQASGDAIDDEGLAESVPVQQAESVEAVEKEATQESQVVGEGEAAVEAEEPGKEVEVVAGAPEAMVPQAAGAAASAGEEHSKGILGEVVPAEATAAESTAAAAE